MEQKRTILHFCCSANSRKSENALSFVRITLCTIWNAKLAIVFRQQMRIQGFNIVLRNSSHGLSILIDVKQEVLINYFQTLPGGLNRTHLTEEEAKEKYYQYWERQQVAICCETWTMVEFWHDAMANKEVLPVLGMSIGAKRDDEHVRNETRSGSRSGSGLFVTGGSSLLTGCVLTVMYSW